MSLTAADAASAYTSKMAEADSGVGLGNAEDVSDFIIRETKVYDGTIWSLRECYRLGLEGVIRGFYISVAGAFMLGLLYNIHPRVKL